MRAAPALAAFQIGRGRRASAPTRGGRAISRGLPQVCFRSCSGLGAEPNRRGAMIGEVLRPEAPDDVVVELRAIDWHLALVVVAEASIAHVLTAAIAIGDDVFLAVGRMLAGADP